MEERRPAEVFPPGEFVKDELEARGWSQSDLADIMGRPAYMISGLVNGKRGITPDIARDLGEAFHTGPEFWLNLDSAYRLYRSRVSDGSVGRRARLYEKAPIKEMMRRNWIEPSGDIDVLEARVTRFFGIRTLEEEPMPLLHAARRSPTIQSETPSHKAWLCRARQLAKAVGASTYSRARLEAAIQQLRALATAPEEARRVAAVLADAGVRFLVVEPLAKTRIDGACFWLDEKSPVVVLSLRYDRIDNFWHTLMHEIGHVLADGELLATSLDDDLAGTNSELMATEPEAERNAEAFAAEALVPQTRLDGFIARVHPLFSKTKIRGFAGTMSIHPGIVVGQLQYRGEIPHSHSREMLVKIRDTVTQSALTDGWGNILPADI